MSNPLVRTSDSTSITTSTQHGRVTAAEWVILASTVILFVLFGVLHQESLAVTAGILGIAAFGLVRYNVRKMKVSKEGVEFENAVRAAHEAAEEAKATVVQVRTLAAAIGKIALDQIGLRNRLGLLSPRVMLSIRERVVTTLRTAGCSADDIADATRMLTASIRYDMASRIGEAVNRHALGPYLSGKCHDLLGSNFDPSPASEFSALLAANSVTDTDVLKCLDEYAQHERTGEVPSFEGDPNYFFDRLIRS